MAFLLIGLFSLGIYMHELPLSPDKLKLYSWHKWAGVTAFILILLRLLWRVRAPAAAVAGSDAQLAEGRVARHAPSALRVDGRHPA
jgi:cytochrome b561